MNWSSNFRRSWGPDGIVSNMLNCDMAVSNFELQSCYNIHFRTNIRKKGMKPLTPQFWVKSTAAVLLQGWLWN